MKAPWMQTLRLDLREFARDDFDDLLRLHSDPRVMKYVDGGKTSSRKDVEAALTRVAGYYASGTGWGYGTRFGGTPARSSGGTASSTARPHATSKSAIGCCTKHGGKASRPRAQRNSSAMASTISASTGSSASRIPTIGRRNAF